MMKIILIVVAGIAVNILYSEFCQWSEWLQKKLLKLATLIQSNSPSARHDFYPEWQSIVENSKGSDLTKLLFATGAIISAIRIASPLPHIKFTSNKQNIKNPSLFNPNRKTRIFKQQVMAMTIMAMFYSAPVGIGSDVATNYYKNQNIPTIPKQSPIEYKIRETLPAQESGRLIITQENIDINSISEITILDRTKVLEVDSIKIYNEKLALAKKFNQDVKYLVRTIPLLPLTLLMLVVMFFAFAKRTITKFRPIVVINSKELIAI